MSEMIERTKGFDQQHAPLAQRVAAIATSLYPSRPVTIADAGEAGRVDAAQAIIVQRGAHPMLSRNGFKTALTYADPTDEASLGALLAALGSHGGPIAADPESLAIVALADRLAASDIPVLINGPTGTGKEVISRFIHDRSARRDKPFVAVNCAAIPETMLEAMLFGHQKGAFTGALNAGEGFFRAAEGGTLLLDEIAEMPLSLQAKLLRALQEGEVVPVGATAPVKVDIRVIACANRDLPAEVEQGRFRADLYFRLSVFPLALPALRERPADIVPLSFAMLLRHVPKGKPVPWLSDAAIALLKSHGWPGNVRELENVMRRALLLAGGEMMIDAAHVVFDRSARLISAEGGVAATPPAPSTFDDVTPPSRLSDVVQLSEARAIMNTLDACGGRRAEAARKLGISERTLRYRLASFREAGLAVGGRR